MAGKPCAFLRPSIKVDKTPLFFASFSKLLLKLLLQGSSSFKLSLKTRRKQDEIHTGE